MATKKVVKQEDSTDLDILMPNRTVIIGGKDVVVREYGFYEGGRLAPFTAPIIASLKEIIREKQDVQITDLLQLTYKHIDEMLELLAIATGEDKDWIAALPQKDGATLATVWWGVNGPFCVETAVVEYQLSPNKQQEEIV